MALWCCLMIFAVVSALAVCGPALYWRFKKSFGLSASSKFSCPPCICDCPPPLSLLEIAPGGHELSKSTGNAGGRIACGIIGLQG